jgi:hypothetical protein
MSRAATRIVLLVLLVALPAGAASAESGDRPEPALATQILDASLVRPLALVVATASSGVFLGTLPLTWLTGVGDEAAHLLVEAPWRYTAGRVLGDFDRYEDGRDLFGRLPPGQRRDPTY